MKQTMEPLRESKEKLRVIFESIKDGVAIVDLEGNVVEANEAHLRMFGYSHKEELLGQNCFDSVAEKDRARAMEDMRKLFEEERSAPAEYTLCDKDGREFYAELSAALLRDSSGNPVGIVSVTRDITERKKAEEKIKKAAEEWRKTFDAISDFAYIIDKDFRFVKVNKAICAVLKKEPKDLIGKRCYEVIHGTDEPWLNCPCKKMLVTKKAAIAEINDPNLGVPLLVTASPIFDDNGELIGCVHIAKDITERKLMEEVLRESEEKFRNIFESANDCMIHLDRSGRILDVNGKAVEVFGGSKKEVLGKHFTRLGIFSLKDIPTLLSNFAKILASKKVTLNVRIKNKKGREIHLECSSSFMKIDEKFAGILVIARDVTERKKMEEQLKEYSEHLEEKVEERTRELKEAQEQLLKAERLAAIGEVAGTVGHDLRNPLQAIVNTFYLAKKKLKSVSCPLEEKHDLEELCGRIQEQVDYMNKIVSDLQYYARPLKPELVETSLHQLINETLSTITVPENVKVSMVIEEDFPKLMVDPTLMKRVFTNLVKNALQAMPKGGQLTITSSKKEETAFVSIQDTGVGIPEENLPKLFQPLFTTKSKGTGFGLPACKRLVEAHDGSITVESKVGKGSTFTVKIPLGKEVS